MADVQPILARFAEAWNRHDVDALAALWTEDGELDHPWGFRAVGRDAVRRLLAEEHGGPMSASVLHLTGVSTRPEAEHVLADIDGLLQHVRAPNGRPYDLRHRIAVLFVPDDGQWRIRTMAAVANPR